MHTFWYFLLAVLCMGIIDILFDIFVIHKELKMNKYDCALCKNINCYYHYCNKKRKELESK